MPRIGLIQPATRMALNPDFASAAPAYPPISACDDELGRPSHQVRRFQTMAPIRPAKMSVGVTMLGSMSPLANVLATAVPANAPMKLNAVAMAMA